MFVKDKLKQQPSLEDFSEHCSSNSNPYLLITGSLTALGGLIIFSLIIWLGRVCIQ
ncbi:hypothetical protein [Mucilaginibacter lappiensis]|uniref:Uncharacterized protein n=1 Tax=Mucilaginibacter lappiensis TaxID=354630 RepID=A0A1N6SKQ3_9SPHI|nr:hypothetical protein [Mucilaginibacter lappiensis]MBB6108341.1 hypothetical protein [Mucilaginibacter lappiensis]MBB6129970.1 hypothetical protein [Mucilaginibacter lappiensis]SIQ41597.1 hypothetical protein SAMN05421821_102422 [Mucilaginibacter lappiensis]